MKIKTIFFLSILLYTGIVKGQVYHKFLDNSKWHEVIELGWTGQVYYSYIQRKS